MKAISEPGGDLAVACSPDVTWHPSAIDRDERWATLGAAGATIWFTGLPGSGKSTIAAAVERMLVERGHVAYRLDGDNLRHGLCGDLGFSAVDRAENVRRVAHAARLFADAGTIALVSLVSPVAADRQLARSLHHDEDLPFLEVHVATPLRVCERRDPKGLYARARAGELIGLTGVDAPYEPPLFPELVIGGCEESVGAQAVRVLQALVGATPAA